MPLLSLLQSQLFCWTITLPTLTAKSCPHEGTGPCPSRSKVLLKFTSPINVAVCMKEGKKWNLTLADTNLLLDHHAANIHSNKSLALVASSFPPPPCGSYSQAEMRFAAVCSD